MRRLWVLLFVVFDIDFLRQDNNMLPPLIVFSPECVTVASLDRCEEILLINAAELRAIDRSGDLDPTVGSRSLAARSDSLVPTDTSVASTLNVIHEFTM